MGQGEWAHKKHEYLVTQVLFRPHEILKNHVLVGEVSEVADEHDLGSCAAKRAGSSPAFPNG